MFIINLQKNSSNTFIKLQKLILNILHFFYPIFKKFMDKQTYYYLVCGGGNTVLGLIVYFIGDHFLFHKVDIDLGFIAFKSHIASLILSIIITFPIGFLLNRYIVWHDSNLNPYKQLYRHFGFVMLFSLMNYVLLKMFVEYFNWWHFPSQFLTISIIVVFSYFAQKYISFRKTSD